MTRRNVLFSCVLALVATWFVACGSSTELPQIEADSLAKIISADTSLDDFKSMLAGFSTEQKKAAGGALADAIEKNIGSIDAWKDKLGGSLPTDQIDAIKSKISSATDVVKGLQGKLGAVVDSLKGAGIDVSKWTELAEKVIG